MSDPTPAFWQAGRALVDAALTGASDGDLVRVLGEALATAGLDVFSIEVACDAVNPDKADHFLRWRFDDGSVEAAICAETLFWDMLSKNSVSARYAVEDERFAPLVQGGATDAVAFASHLAPEVTVGFFDDVMTAFVTRRPGGFSATDIDFLRQVTPVFALAIGARLNAAAARTLLQTYLGEDAATAMLAGRVSLGEVATIRAVVVYCDLFGFTALTEQLDAAALISHLNLFFETITRPVLRAGGQVSGHVGDAVVMYFPLLEAASESVRCAEAVKAALGGMAALDALNAGAAPQVATPLRARMGIDIGEVVHGNIGSARRFSFTIIGTPVNRAARLQALAKDLGAKVLMPASLADLASIGGLGFGRHALRGLDQPVEIVGLRA